MVILDNWIMFVVVYLSNDLPLSSLWQDGSGNYEQYAIFKLSPQQSDRFG